MNLENKKLSKSEQKKINGGKFGSGDYTCSVICCGNASFQYWGPAASCTQAMENASNLCNNYGGVHSVNCNCA